MTAPGAAPARPALGALAQALKVSIIVGSSAFLLSLAAFVAAAFLHRASLFRLGMALLAVCLVSQAVLRLSKVWWALCQGLWTSWRGEAVWRRQRPGWYWRITVRESLFAAGYLTATAALAWFSLR